MSFTLAVLTGLVLGVVLAVTALRAEGADGGKHAAWPPWTAAVLGATGIATMAAGMADLLPDNIFLVVPTIAFPVAGVVLAVLLLVTGHRRWQNWAGLAIGALPMLFWAAFVVGEIFGPAH